jgi:hypothetical protein
VGEYYRRGSQRLLSCFDLLTLHSFLPALEELHSLLLILQIQQCLVPCDWANLTANEPLNVSAFSPTVVSLRPDGNPGEASAS